MDELQLESSGGRFQLDPEGAWLKCSAFQLQDASEAVGALLRAFHILGATSLKVALEPRKIEVVAANLEEIPPLEWLNDPVAWALRHEECGSRFLAMAFLAFQHYGATGMAFLCPGRQVELWGEPVQPARAPSGLHFRADWRSPARVPQPFDGALLRELFYFSPCPIRVHCKIKVRRLQGSSRKLLEPEILEFELPRYFRSKHSPNGRRLYPRGFPVVVGDTRTSSDEPVLAVDFHKGIAAWELPLERNLGRQPNNERYVPLRVRWAPANVAERESGVSLSFYQRRKTVALVYFARLYPLDGAEGCLLFPVQNGLTLNPKLVKGLPPLVLHVAAADLATDLTGRSLLVGDRFHHFFCNLIERLASKLPEVIQGLTLFKGKPQIRSGDSPRGVANARVFCGWVSQIAGLYACLALGDLPLATAGTCLGFALYLGGGSPYLPFHRFGYRQPEEVRKSQLQFLEEYHQRLMAWLAKTREEQLECMQCQA